MRSKKEQTQQGLDETVRLAPSIIYKYSRFTDDGDIHHTGDVIYGNGKESIRLAHVRYDAGRLVTVQFKLGNQDALLEEQIKNSKAAAEHPGILLKFNGTGVELFD